MPANMRNANPRPTNPRRIQRAWDVASSMGSRRSHNSTMANSGTSQPCEYAGVIPNRGNVRSVFQ